MNLVLPLRHRADMIEMAPESARGANSNSVYYEEDILNPTKYAAMRTEVLIKDEDVLVVPVRNKRRPHFRALTRGVFGSRIGPIERDPSHNKCVEKLLTEIQSRRLTLLTKVFREELAPGEVPDDQVLFDQPSGYEWGREHEVRISIGNGTFIQPDIAGRNCSLFHANALNPTVIIEVIRTHPPDEVTFGHLLDLTRIGHLVVFHFIASGELDSKYNRIRSGRSGAVEIRCAYYLAGGAVYKNARVWEQGARSPEEWYQYLLGEYWGPAMEAVEREAATCPV